MKRFLGPLLGVSERGCVCACNETHLGTDFFCFLLLPIVPIRSFVTTRGSTRLRVPLSGLSTVSAYLRVWVLPLSLVGLALVTVDHMSDFLRMLQMGFLGLAMVGAWSWILLGRLDADEKALARVYARTIGHAIDPIRLGDERLRLERELTEKLSRDSLSEALRSKDEARLGAWLTLLRLRWSSSPLERRGELGAQHREVWHVLAPSFADGSE